MTEEDAKPATPQTVEETEQKPTENAVAEEEPQQPEPEPLGEQPEGVMPIFLPKSTKEIYKIVEGENVTEEKPTIFVPKNTLIQDVQFRGVISELTDYKDRVQAYPEDELLFVYDDGDGSAGRVFGENFVICFTIEAKDWMLRLLEEKERKKNEPHKEEKTEEEEEDIPIPPLRKDVFFPREYTQVSDEEVFRHLAITESRPRVKYVVSRRRGDFAQEFKFSDRDAQDWSTDFRSYRDQNFELRRMELEKAVQAVPAKHESNSQTTWFRKQNRALNYTSLDFDDERRAATEESEEFQTFLASATPQVVDALKQNETIDVFMDEFSHLAEDDATVGGKAEQELQECYSFTYMHAGDGQGDKEKPCIGCIDWFPGAKDVVAVSLVSSSKLDDRLELDGKMRKSYILIWNFADQINPELVLEAPSEVHAFKFHPENKDMIVAGCSNGQVLVYELKEAREQAMLRKKGKKDGTSQGPAEVPTVKYSKISTIEGSHKKDISDLKWLGKETVVKPPYGKRVDNEEESKGTKQFITVSFDGQVLIWDLDYMKKEKDPRKEKPDLVWVPIYKCQLSFNDGTAGKRETGISSFMLPNDRYGTQFYCVSDMGELVRADWVKREGEEGEVNHIVDCLPLHTNPCVGVQRAPLLPSQDIILTMGDTTFNIYKEGIPEPLFHSRSSNVAVTAGLWSPTRHGVVFVAKADGSIDIWDLLDRSHEPSMTVNVSSFPLTSLAFWNIKSTAQQYIAVGDSNGTLFVLDIPRNLRRPLGAEEGVVKGYFDREVSRVEYCRARLDTERNEGAELAREQAEEEARQAELAAKEAQAQADQQAQGNNAATTAAAQTSTSEAEKLIDEKQEAAYKDMEAKFWEELGLTKEEPADAS